MAKALPSTRSTPADYLRRIEDKLDALSALLSADRKDETTSSALAKYVTPSAPMTGKEVAAILGVKPKTVFNLSASGALPRRFGKDLYSSDDVRD